MKRITIPLMLFVLAAALSACAGNRPERMPTPIPRYTESAPILISPLQSSQVAQRPIDTPMPTEAPTQAPTQAPTATEETVATEEPTATPTTEPTATATNVATATPAATVAAEASAEDGVSESEVVTDTVPLNLEADAEAPEQAATTEEAEAPATETEAAPATEQEATEQEATDEETPGAEAPAEAENTASTESTEATTGALAELPAEMVAALAGGDITRGEQLVLMNGCTACHSMQEGVIQVGPSWYNLAGHAETRVPGVSAEAYLYDSIIHPNNYLVEGFQPNLMPQLYEMTLTQEQLADIITYMLTLRGEE